MHITQVARMKLLADRQKTRCDKYFLSMKNSFISQFSEHGLFSAKLDKLCNFNGRPNYGKNWFSILRNIFHAENFFGEEVKLVNFF